MILDRILVMREKTIEQYLVKRVHKIGGEAVKFVPTFFVGFPDRIVLMPKAAVYFVELKAPGKKPSPVQKQVHAQLEALGHEVFIIDSKEGVDEFINLIAIQ